jgi:hypothetical protein
VQTNIQDCKDNNTHNITLRAENMSKYKNIEKNQSMADIAHEILKINGTSMFYKDIWKIMQQDIGYISHGKSPETSLNSVLGRDSRFFKHRGMVELLEWFEDEEEEEQILVTSCPSCETEIQTDFNYCPCCQSKFKIKVVCPHCQNVLKAFKTEWLICPYCGEELPENPDIEIEIEEEEEKIGDI